MADEHDDKNLDKKIVSLLKDFYQPTDLNESVEEAEFEVFYRTIEEKLEKDTTQNKISLMASELEYQFLNRQQRLFQAKNRLESGFFEIKQNKFKSRKLIRNSMIIGSFLVCVALTSIATFKQNDAYKVVDFEAKEEAWANLSLTPEQKNKINELDNQWQSYRNFELEKIQVAKTRLQKEINQESPDLSLINKYQREIFDLELHLQQQKFNNNLEKRFVLEPEQSIEFIRESQS
jgi:Spy/CpxP family protein refolding chaperone